MPETKEHSMPAGRPSKYDPKYCQMLIDHMELGLSYESFAGLIGVARQTLYDWEKVNPAFLDTKKIAAEKSLLWWEQKGIDGLFSEEKGIKINATIWIFNMKNRHNWKDKTEIEQTTKEIKIIIGEDESDL